MKEVDIKCEYCSKIFKDYLSNKRKYCSMKCRNNGLMGREPWNKGTKGKMIAWNKGLKGYNKDYPRNKEWKDKISFGKKNSLKSTLASKKAGKKMGDNNKGKNNWNWKGGISYEPYSTDWTKTLKRSIRERDNYICKLCNKYGNIVHHIDYNKKNSYSNNLITLCNGCHTKTNSNREYWIKYFINLCQKKYQAQ